MHWLIDGHNLIGQMSHLRLDDPDDEAKLVEYLRGYRARTGHRVTVVFDAGAGYHSAKTKKVGGVTVQFARPDQTADQIIARRVRQIKNPQELIVVTSDRAVQQAAGQSGVRVLTARAFAQQLLQGPSPTTASDQGSQIEVKLSKDEVEEWLKIFKK